MAGELMGCVTFIMFFDKSASQTVLKTMQNLVDWTC